MHQYGAQHRAGSNNYSSNKNFGPHGGQPQMGQSHGTPTGPQGRAPDGPEDGK